MTIRAPQPGLWYVTQNPLLAIHETDKELGLDKLSNTEVE